MHHTVRVLLWPCRYTIDSATEELLKRFFRPYNRRLFKLLGYEIHEWA